MYSTDKKKYELVKVMDHQGVILSENCQKKGKMDCVAWKAVQNKVALQETPGVGVIGNPAARYCLSQKSVNRILLDEKGKEYDFCVFPDGSLVDAWSLFNKHFESKK